MFQAGFRLCIVAIGVLSGTGQAQLPGQTQSIPTQLQYYCGPVSANMVTIYMDLPSDYHSVFAAGTKDTNNNHECTVKNIGGQNYSISDCQKDAPVLVVLMKVTQANILGGGGLLAFELTCNSGDGMKNGVGDFNVSRVASMTQLDKPDVDAGQKENEIIGLSMHIKPENSNHHDIFIGDTLYIVIAGPRGPKYGITQCIASSVNHAETKMSLITSGTTDPNAINLLESSGFAEDQGTGASDHKLFKCDSISGWNKQTSICIAATMHAFHFKNDPGVKIECSITICRHNSNNQNCTISSSRKRRGSEPDDTGRTGARILSQTITVYDRSRVETPAAPAGCAKHMVTFVMMLVLSGFAWISNRACFEI